MDISPAEIVPFVMALVAALAGMLFARRSNDSRPFSLVAAVLYALAIAFFLLGIIAWVMRAMK
jgi:hypothetical protein